MAYDEVLAERIRALIGPDPELTEKKMFGGLAFLIRGHMAISASGQGGVLVHVAPERSDELVASTAATIAVMQGREMPGWLRVAADSIATDDDLSPWVRDRHRVRPVAAAQVTRATQETRAGLGGRHRAGWREPPRRGMIVRIDDRR